MWYREAEVEGGVIYGTKTVLYGRESMNTSPEECWKMKEFKMCGEQQMKQHSIDTWGWEAQPSQEVTWMGHVTNKELNCLLEEVALEKRCENCAVTTPFGSLSPSKHQGNFSQHQVTLVWKNNWQKNKPCALHQINLAANGTLTHLNSGSFRLRNKEQQSDYLIRPRDVDNNGNAVSSTLCGKSNTYYDVLGMNKVVMILSNTLNSSAKLEAGRKEIARTTNATQELINAINQAAHLQFVRDAVIDQENVLVRELQYLQCEIKKNHHLNAVATAQYNGWLAARQLSLPVCSKLHAVGEAVQIIQCKEERLNFTMVTTRCGYQPKHGNSTISTTGWELTRFLPCYHTTNFVNFNGVVYHYVGEDWTPVPMDIELTEHKLLPSFATRLDNTFNYSIYRNPGLVQDSLEHVSVVADIIAQIHEVHTSGKSSFAHVSEVLPSKDSNHFFNWLSSDVKDDSTWFKMWNVIKWVTMVTITIMALIPITYIFWKTCTFCKRRLPKVDELELPTLIKPTQEWSKRFPHTKRRFDSDHQRFCIDLVDTSRPYYPTIVDPQAPKQFPFAVNYSRIRAIE